jgi:hypothetical protein
MKRLLLILFCVIFLSGCASPLAEQRLENNADPQENASHAADSARKDKLLFLDCLREYATKNSQLPMTTTEIAEAAVGDRGCQISLMNYEMNIESYYSNLGYMSAQSFDETQQIEDQARYLAKKKRQELLDTGKRQVINLLDDLRQSH